MPLLYDYSSVLESWDINATAQSTIRLSYDVCLRNYESNGLEVISAEVLTGGVWQEIDRMVNDTPNNADIAWTNRNVDISGYVHNTNFRLRFRAHGLSSFYIDSWEVDNIRVYVPDPVVIEITNPDWDYGEISLNQSEVQAFTITNTSASPLSITNIWMEGDDMADFILTTPTLPILVDQPVDFQVTFTPLSLGVKHVTINIQDTQTRVIHTVQLTGIAVPQSLPAPDMLTCLQSEGCLTLTWNPVSDATEYKVYSSATPDGIYTEELNCLCTGTTWTCIPTDERRFYKVIAIYNPARAQTRK